MKKFLFCNSCFLIMFYKDRNLASLSRYKDRFFISDTQITGELGEIKEIASIIRNSIRLIKSDREEIKVKTKEFTAKDKTLSVYDCLCMAYSVLDGFCLITDDKAFRKKCAIYDIETKSSKDIIDEFIIGGDFI